MKTKSAAKKRFKLTASGKVKFKPTKQRHILSHEASKVKRKRRALAVVPACDSHRVERYFPGQL